MIKRILLTFCILLFSYNSSIAIEEIILDTNDEEVTYTHLVDLYAGKVEKTKSVAPIIKMFSSKGLTFENSIINSLKLSFLYDGQLNYYQREKRSNSLIYDFSAVEPGLRLKFFDNKVTINVTYNFLSDVPSENRHNFSEKFSNLYVAYDFNKNQRVLFGQGRRLPVNYDGSLSRMEQDFVLRSQIGRNLGNYRSVGIRNIAKYKYIDYDFGFYDATRYMEDFGRGYDFTGYLLLKPFANFENSIKTLKFGSGYNLGEYNSSYNVYSFFLSYDYKKFHFKSEYANADGCNSVVYSRNKSDGFYTSLSYDITPNVAIHTRYDYFNKNKSLHNCHTQEYTVGIVYKIYENLKIFFDIAHQNNSNSTDSNLFLFATRFYI